MSASYCISRSISDTPFYTDYNIDDKVVTEQPVRQAGQTVMFACSVIFSMPHGINRNNHFHTSRNNTNSSFRCGVQTNDTNCQGSAMSGDLCLDRLDEIAALEDDWNGYGAKKFSKKLIEKCRKILYALPVRPKIYPTGRQSIQFQYELEDRSYLEFEIFEVKTVCLLVPRRKYSDAVTKDFSEAEIDKIKEIVNNFYGQSSKTK